MIGRTPPRVIGLAFDVYSDLALICGVLAISKGKPAIVFYDLAILLPISLDQKGRRSRRSAPGSNL